MDNYHYDFPMCNKFVASMYWHNFIENNSE